MVLQLLCKTVLSAVQIEARGKMFGLICTADIPQYVVNQFPALLTSFSL